MPYNYNKRCIVNKYILGLFVIILKIKTTTPIYSGLKS